MKLSEYIKNLQKVYEEHGDLECWYSSDDEGNSFHKINYTPTILYYDDEEVLCEEDLEISEDNCNKDDVEKIVVVN